MITKLEIENFKALRGKHEIPLAPITLIYGPNSGGKSSVIQALALLKQSMDAGRFMPRGRLVDLGSFYSCVWKHDDTKPIRLGITARAALGVPGDEWDYPEDWSFSGASGLWAGFTSRRGEEGSRVRLDTARYWREYTSRSEPLDVRFRYAPSGRKRAHTNRYSLSGAKSRLWLKRHLEVGGSAVASSDLSQYWASVGKNLVPDEIHRPVVAPQGAEVQQGSEALAVGAGLASPTSANNALAECIRRVQSVLDAIRYIGPLRTRPTRTFSPLEETADWVGAAGENAAQLLMEGLGEGMSSPFCSRFLRWLKEMDIPYKLHVRPVGDQVLGDGIRTTLVDQRTKVSVGLADVGSGVGQVLPLLVQGAFGGAQVLCVEQPELHLHPRAQAALGDVFIESARVQGPESEWGDATQWIAETHSETLLLRIKRRIREGLIPPETICVLYVNPGRSGSVVTRLRLDAKGDFIDEWPSGFFEEAFNEVFS